MKLHTYAVMWVSASSGFHVLPAGACLKVVAESGAQSVASHQAIVGDCAIQSELPVYRGISLNPESEQRIAAIVAEC